MNAPAAQSTAVSQHGRGRARRGGASLFRRYLTIAVVTAAVAAAGVLALNTAIDPLWYGRGNILTGVNFAFNERFAKLNYFLRTMDRYDCVILGSSRTTLLDQRRIKGHTCANLAFSAGIAPEFIAYAKYIKARGFLPKLVIVGVDAFNFWRDMTPVLPDFVETGDVPQNIVRSYLSSDVLWMSTRTLFDDPPFSRFYDRNFVGRVWREGSVYKPPEPSQIIGKQRHFHPSRVAYYRELRAVFPHAAYVGYVPPLSAWLAVEELYLTANFQEYLRAMKAIAEGFDGLIDFSLPSEITMNPRNTYDGDHFTAVVNGVIADALQGKTNHFGFDVRAATLPAYRAAYEEAAGKFLKAIGFPGQKDGG